jgi:hypothetical protein
LPSRTAIISAVVPFGDSPLMFAPWSSRNATISLRPARRCVDQRRPALEVDRGAARAQLADDVEMAFERCGHQRRVAETAAGVDADFRREQYVDRGRVARPRRHVEHGITVGIDGVGVHPRASSAFTSAGRSFVTAAIMSS